METSRTEAHPQHRVNHSFFFLSITLANHWTDFDTSTLLLSLCVSSQAEHQNPQGPECSVAHWPSSHPHPLPGLQPLMTHFSQPHPWKTPRGIDMRDKSKRAGAKSLTAFDWISVSPGWNVRCKGGRCSCIDSASGLRDNNTHSLANRLTLSPEESWVSWGGEWETSNKQPQPLRLHGPTQLDPALCRVPLHYYCTTSWAFITSLILTQKLHFSGTLRFLFFFFFCFFFSTCFCVPFLDRNTNRFTPQEYSASASMWLNQWVRSEIVEF